MLDVVAADETANVVVVGATAFTAMPDACFAFLDVSSPVVFLTFCCLLLFFFSAR